MSGAIVSEIAATAALKAAVESHGQTRGALAVVTATLYLACYISLAWALARGIDLSVGYAVWSGLGIAVLTVLGVAVFGEGMPATKIVALLLIVAGVALLYLRPTPAAPITSAAAGRPASAAALADPVTTTSRSPQ